MNETTNVSSKILENLKKCKKHVSILCLECGYNGLMGVKSEKSQWGRALLFGTGIALISMNFIGLSNSVIVWGLAVGALSEVFKTRTLLCPNCEKDLIQK